ncbi:MAG TPA: ribose 5-phosphate isomerase B [Pyrinomonadaceae bacterium]|nr:ribose 5-phosphate isomerase B [Pyrinomonadaceae bacterium]
MSVDDETRDRVRALVRDVLQNALPEEDAPPQGRPRSSVAAPETQTQSRFINIAPEPRAAAETAPEFTRDESSKQVITEDDVRGLEEGARLRIAEGARLTPLAADIVRELKIELVRRRPRRGSRESKMIAVGSDHGGFKMKEELKVLLAELGHRVHDYGTDSETAVDYPDFAHAVARAVADTQADVGIIIDGAGVGSCMTANKVPGVRAAACYSVAVAKNSREHNDANVLTLGSQAITSALMREIVEAWLSTTISEDRHRKRVAKITAIERQYAS